MALETPARGVPRADAAPPLRRRPITARLAAIALAHVAIVLVLLAVVWVAMAVNHGARAYVGGEGLWSKAQKDAVYYLTRYARTREEADWNKYQAALAIPLGDHLAREEMERAQYDPAVVTRGFLAGRNAAEDIPYMIALFRCCRGVEDFAHAVSIWTQADAWIAELVQRGEQLRVGLSLAPAQGGMAEAEVAELLERVEQINDALTPLEYEFSATLGSAARWVRMMAISTILGAAAVLIAVGLALTWSLSRELRGGVAALRAGALRVAHGDLVHDVEVQTQDELGELAQVFNDMVAQRRKAEAALTTTSDQLAVQVERLARSNAELEQFAYVASHDLQEPLRTVTSYTQLLAQRYGERAGPDAAEFTVYVTEAATRMRDLIQGLLEYARLAPRDLPLEKCPLDHALDAALANLASSIKVAGARIERETLPTLRINAAQVTQLFQNLVGNALKFRGTTPPVVRVRAERGAREWTFSVSDNGIGVDPQFAERIFVLFQRLHTRDRYPGTGLGLAICRKIVQVHGGRIWVEPALGGGASFRFTLPA